MMNEKTVDKYKFASSDVLGTGSFAQVYKGIDTTTNRIVAIKMLPKQIIQRDKYLLDGLKREISVMQKLKGNNVVRLLDMFESSNNYYIIQEFCKDGDLGTYLQKQPYLTEIGAIRILTDILSGFIELLQQGIIHRDLKPANILIHQNTFKLGDFGFAKCMQNFTREVMESRVGTPLYMAPQILMREPYTSKCDIWSIGCIFYECIFRRTPWMANSIPTLLNQIIKYPIQFPSYISADAKDFILKCLVVDEAKRIDWNEVYRHPLIYQKFKDYVDQVKNLEAKAEFIISELRQLIVMNQIDLLETFKKLCIQDNQFLSFKELQQLLNEINPNLNRQEIEFVFNLIDVDKQNSIDFLEFQKCLQQHKVRLSLQDFKQDTEIPYQNSPLILQVKWKGQLEKIQKKVEDEDIGLVKLFKQFDSDNNQILDLVEFVKFARQQCDNIFGFLLKILLTRMLVQCSNILTRIAMVVWTIQSSNLFLNLKYEITNYNNYVVVRIIEIHCIIIASQSQIIKHKRVIQQIMLEAERKQASFPSLEMSHLLYGGKENFDRFMDRQSFFDNHPMFQANHDFYNKSRQEQVLINAQKTVEALKKIQLTDPNYFTPNVLCPQGIFISTVHFAMVVPAFNVLASDEQIQKWMPLLSNFHAFGCYAQTELGHGSDVQNLQTVAVFDRQTSEFVIHTPTIEATKFWPGELGLYCEYALVFAQLMVEGKNYGVHPFWVRIRDQRTHLPVSGVQLGDIGPKMGYSVKDNGYMSFDHYRAPIDSLLNRYIKVSREGKVERQGNPKVGYGSMMYMRNILCDQYTKFGGRALAIAIRYSLYRKQFKDDNKQEIRILDYQCQQAKLFPLLSEFYACVFGSIRIKELVNDNFNRITTANDFSLLGLTHAVLSGAKANYTYFVSNCAEWCRLSCGGHGFAHYSGLPIIFFEMAPNITLEGENTILNLQLARYLLKQLQHTVSKPSAVPEFFKFLSLDTARVDDATSLAGLTTLLGLNCSLLTKYAAQKLMSHSDMKESWDTKSGIALAKAASTFTPYFNMLCFVDTIQNKAKETKQILEVLARIYGISKLLENMQGLLLKNQITGDQIRQLQDTREQLYSILRPNALALVEAQGLSDNSLQSLIAPKEGDVYLNMYNFASKDNSLNHQSVHDGINYIKKMRDVNAKL